jgi:HD-GYP domain-containing protein (c-di-GMP phosphodiesterase class II)
LLATLLLAQGTPMLAAGDEFGHSQHGNNNPYCQDNPTTWIDWSLRDEPLQQFTARLLALRRQWLPMRPAWYTGLPDANGLHDLSWLRRVGGTLSDWDWTQAASRVLANATTEAKNAALVTAADLLVTSMINNPDAVLLVNRLRAEAVDTYRHSVNVALYMIALGRQLGLPARELVHLGTIGMLADVGKLKLPRALLDKPGVLTPEEFAEVKEHVRLGLERLSASGVLPPEVVLGIGQHHERLDGSGYPDGLARNQISIYGRMAAIADNFSALTTPRAYAKTRSPQDAMMSLYEWSGTLFHEPLGEQFVQAVGVFPVGSLVELSSGEVAIIVAHNRARRLEPKVLVITGSDKAPLAKPVERDLLRLDPVEGERLRIARGLPAGGFGIKMRDYFGKPNGFAGHPAT